LVICYLQAVQVYIELNEKVAQNALDEDMPQQVFVWLIKC